MAVEKKTGKKKVAKKKVAKKTVAKPSNAAKTGKSAPVVPVELHGVTLSVGDVKKALKGKGSIVTMLPRKVIKIVQGFNPRTVVTDLEPLAKSIKKNGLLSPLVVRPALDKPGSFLLVAGERRLRASDLLGLTELAVTIRMDLESEDASARAVAVAENSEEGRTNLNPIEIGRVVNELATKHEWGFPRIAQETGLHVSKIRRCMTLMGAPKDVQEHVESGAMSLIAGLELTKVDGKTRGKQEFKDALEPGMSAAAIKKLAKKTAKADNAPTPGKSAQHLKGAARDAALKVRKGSREKETMLRLVSDIVHKAKGDEIGTTEYHVSCAVAATLLWDRGAIDSPFPPELDDKTKAGKAALKAFKEHVADAASKHKPETEDETEE
jgi:ParB/RepB/Spo0J family partition protein